MLAIAVVGVFAAAFMGGTTGFGFGLVLLPWLLALGFPLPFVITAIMGMTCAIRLGTVVRLHAAIDRRRAAMMLTASVPGAILGVWTLEAVDERVLQIAAGALVMLVALALALARGHGQPAAPLRGGPDARGRGGRLPRHDDVAVRRRARPPPRARAR